MFKTLRSLLAVLALAFVLIPTIATAGVQIASSTVTTGAGGALFRTTDATALTYSSRTVAGPGIIITKMWASPSVTYTAASVELWDCPQGLTYASGARKVLPAQQLIAGIGVREWNFTTDKSSRTDEDGIYIRNYPVVVTSGTNTPNASIQFRKALAPSVLPSN